MKITLSSTALSGKLAVLARIICKRERLAMFDLFAGGGYLEVAVTVAAPSYDYDQVITYYKEARDENDNPRKKTTTRTLTEIFDDIFGSTEHSRTTVAAYNLRNGEHAQYKHDEQKLQHRSQRDSEAHSDACRWLWTRRKHACVQGDRESDGLLAVVGGGGESACDEVLQGGACSRAVGKARDGVRQAPGGCAQRQHQSAAGADGRFASLWRWRHRAGEFAGAWGKCQLHQSLANLKAA